MAWSMQKLSQQPLLASSINAQMSVPKQRLTWGKMIKKIFLMHIQKQLLRNKCLVILSIQTIKQTRADKMTEIWGSSFKLCIHLWDPQHSTLPTEVLIHSKCTVTFCGNLYASDKAFCLFHQMLPNGFHVALKWFRSSGDRVGRHLWKKVTSAYVTRNIWSVIM